MSSVPVWHKIKTFVCPSGKRRRTKRTTTRADIPVMPLKPVYPPKPSRAPVAALPPVPDVLALEQRIMEQIVTGRTGEMLRDFGDLYRAPERPVGGRTGRTVIEPPAWPEIPRVERSAPVAARMHVDPPPIQLSPRHVRPEPITRVVLRSDNPEIDQTIVAGTSWLPKVLVRPETVERLTPVALPALGTTGMRLTIANPVKTPVTDRTPVSGVVVPVPVSGGSTAVMERWEEQDTQDILITDEWRDMFRTETAHVCRSCLKYGRGVVGDDGRWICGRCYSSGTY